MGAYKQATLGELDQRRSKKDKEIDDLKQKLYTLETLVERYGLCHPDLQVGRMTRDEAFKKYLQEMRDNRVKRVEPNLP